MPAKVLYKNEYLFSEAYLAEITQIEASPDVTATLNTLKEFREFAHTSSLNDWNRSYIHEVLFTLKFNLKPVDDNLTELFELGNTDSPISICVSLLPGENLDNTLLGTNWAEKVIRNLRKYNLKWGILTNGDFWRIYHTEEPTPYETFLEINLKEIEREGNCQAFQIFTEFLQAGNFVLNKNGMCHFDQFKQESQDKIDYIEEELGKALKQAEEGGKGILASLCQGYIRYLKNTVTTNFQDDNLTDTIYRSSMLYMFRLLFLLYAEARNLLDDDEMQMLDDIKNNAFQESKASTASFQSYELWKMLNGLFGHIDEVYNGGLFNPAENDYTRFIQENRLDDYCIATVIYHLCHYKEKSGETKKISYRDLSVRHLGSLYEGLLEHKLRVAEEDTEVKHLKKEIKYIPQSKGGIIKKGNHIPAGAVYFAGDKGERKTTGSYYTPEYIVEFIVNNTVAEKLNELNNGFKERNKKTLQAIERAIDEAERLSLQDTFLEELDRFIYEEVLGLSILDPAMGSGHFLVNATNTITNFITETMNEFGYIDKTRETSTVYWRRRVVENCIYGVDINPLAVELAKLSLWILSMSKGKPLSFLNHHLKCGNSLIGCRLQDLGKYPLAQKKAAKQLVVYDIMQDQAFQSNIQEAIKKILRIQGIDTIARKNVEEKGEILAEIDKKLKPYKKLCDFHTKVFFDSKIGEEEYNFVFKYVNDWIQLLESNTLKNNNELYFHWELEFPEILLLKNGFDCIIGNPPFGTPTYFSKKYFLINNIYITNGSQNLAGYFINIAQSIVNNSGFVGLVLPKSIAHVSGYKGLRNSLLKWFVVNCIVDLGQAFDKVGLEQMILIFSRNKDIKYILNYNICNSTISLFGRTNFGLVKKLNIFPMYIDEAATEILEKINKNSVALRELCFEGNKVNIFRGLSLQSKVEYLSEKDERKYKPIIGGRNITSYTIWDYEEEPYKYLKEYKNDIFNNFGSKHIICKNIISSKVRIEATFNEKMWFNYDTITNVILSEDCIYPVEYILAILNSRLIAWFLRDILFNRSILTMHLDEAYLGNIPICKWQNTKEQREVVELCKKLLEIKPQKKGKGVTNIKDIYGPIMAKIDELLLEIYDFNQYKQIIWERTSYLEN
ncbi:MAG: N-6 DNA methylase [Clostridiales bacterium]|nr:N-6 DNA methylase [Clostridiales bacterium]